MFLLVVVLIVTVVGNGYSLRCYECGLTSGRCNVTHGWNTTECNGSNPFCFTGAEGRGCMSNCTTTYVARCCDSDLCNNETARPANVTTPTTAAATTTTAVTTTTTAVPGSPLQCYDCSQGTKERCDEFKKNVTCNVGDVCRLVDRSSFFGNSKSYIRDCSPRANCQEKDDCKTHAGNCIKCCDCDLCNDGDSDTRLSCSLAPLQCYDCSQGTKERCDEFKKNVTCNVGDVCRLVDHSSFFGNSKSYIRDCSPRANCQEKDDCKTHDGNCIRCCESDLCNGGDIVFLTTTAPPTTTLAASTTTTTNTTNTAHITNPMSSILLAIALLVVN